MFYCVLSAAFIVKSLKNKQMTKDEQMLNALKSVEVFLRNQDLSEIGMQVKGKVLEAINRVEETNRTCTMETFKISMEEASEKGMTNIINDLIHKSACISKNK